MTYGVKIKEQIIIIMIYRKVVYVFKLKVVLFFICIFYYRYIDQIYFKYVLYVHQNFIIVLLSLCDWTLCIRQIVYLVKNRRHKFTFWFKLWPFSPCSLIVSLSKKSTAFIFVKCHSIFNYNKVLKIFSCGTLTKFFQIMEPFL